MPVSLEILNLSGGESYGADHKFTGGIPAEWSLMTNLKQLKMAKCGLDGEFVCRTKQTQRLMRETGERDSEPFCNFHAECSSRVPAGAIPASIGGLSNLQMLNLGYNPGLTGTAVFILCRFR